jgi:hypothetical protein
MPLGQDRDRGLVQVREDVDLGFDHGLGAQAEQGQGQAKRGQAVPQCGLDDKIEHNASGNLGNFGRTKGVKELNQAGG